MIDNQPQLMQTHGGSANPELPTDPLQYAPLPFNTDTYTEIYNYIKHSIRNKGVTITESDVTGTWQELLNRIAVSLGDSVDRENHNYNNILLQWLLDISKNGFIYDMAGGQYLEPPQPQQPQQPQQPPPQQPPQQPPAQQQPPPPPQTYQPQQQLAPPPPPNPISDSQEPQQAQPPTPPPSMTQSSTAPENTLLPTDPEQMAAYDRLSGEQCKSMRGLKMRLTKTHKTSWPDYCTRYGLDTDTGLPIDGTPQPHPTPQSQQPDQKPPSGPGAAPLQGMEAQPAMTPHPAYPQPPPQQPPPQQSQPTAPSTQPPQLPVQVPQQEDLNFQNTPPPPAYQYDPMSPAQPIQPTQPAQQPAADQGAEPHQPLTQMSKAELARALGGEVELLLLEYSDAGAVDLSQYADVNQLARMAEVEVVRQMNVEDLADIKGFKKGDQIKERIFSDYLNKNNKVYILKQGAYDWIVDNRMVPVLFSRVTKLHLVTKGGSTIDTITL